MKLKHTLALALLTFGVTAPVISSEKNAILKEFNDFDVRLMEAKDARDHQNPVFDEALEAEDWRALVFLGQIGGEACERIKPYLTHKNEEVREAAAYAAGFCHDSGFDSMLAEVAQNDGSSGALNGMAFSGAEQSRAYLIETINGIQLKERLGKCNLFGMDAQESALFALMQSIVYDRLDASALPELDVLHLLSLTADRCFGYEAAYLLGRLQKLDEGLTLDAVIAAMGAAPNPDVQRALVRVLRQFGNEAADYLVAIAGVDDTQLAMEAVRAMGSLSDPSSKLYLMEVARDGSVPMRHLALSALAGRDGMDTDITQLIAASVQDENPWIAVTALRGLNQRSPEEALKVAEEWFAGDDYYKAFSAMGLLAQSDEGEAILEEYAAANPDTIRGREAAIALDPSIEGIEKPRKTPSWNMVLSYQGRELKLETTRGTVCIAPSHIAPYAAANFMLLADVGKMNSMLWHRVIPNFVAQAGQSEDPELASWGTIREEWGGQHVKGSVGVATAGRDTGSAQFFINTAYNLHLDGRYTVMGNVISGMDAAMALQEGDVITRAETVMAGKCR
ncbi:peptidylprolyl isomerase [Kordiimonas lacus]|uniref:peptidylprolyl isomerase n=1 Tax=Kordiimonas lacus TaxID=637679 RepID=A0A1G7EZE3_9PROT|nr:peptidylprolyl isomerase [Kordiimonas lacus]SDE69053.1 Peptidyl-prolyl cis-trans isomerase (rotamase)-cyclophilin family [Kordiimonas lacus]